MKKIKLIAVFAAIILGLCIYNLADDLGKPADTPRTAVVVAAVDIPENTKITAEMLTMQEVATEALSSSHVEDPASVVGMVTSDDIYAGEQVVSNRLVSVGTEDSAQNNTQSSTLAYKVDEGMRAVTLSVGSDDANALGGMLKPGNRLDIYMYYSYEAEAEETAAPVVPVYDDNGNPVYDENGELVYTTTTVEDDEAEPETVNAVRLLLQNVLILAVDKVMNKDGTTEDAYSNITLQLSPEEAGQLLYGEMTSNLRFVLRSPVDTEILEVTDTTLETILNAGEEATEP